jgi:hypothetical protein
MSYVRSIIADTRNRIAGDLKTLSKLEALLLKIENEPAIKRPDGRLSDFGIGELEAAFAAGEIDADIARRLDISPSAVSYRRRIWSDKQAASDV